MAGRRGFAAIVVVCAVALLGTAGWRLFSDDGPEVRLAEVDDDSYASPVWAADGWIYLLRRPYDSESSPTLVKVRPGHAVVDVPVTVPGCARAGPALYAVFPMADAGTLGLMSTCEYSDEQGTLLAYSVQTGAVTAVGRYRYDYGPVSWRGDGAIYTSPAAGVCDAGVGVMEVRADTVICLPGAGRPAVAGPGDVLHFAAPSCSPGAAATSGRTVCRWDRSTGTGVPVPVVQGFTAVQDIAAHPSGRLVIIGERQGRKGLWLADPGRPPRRITDVTLTGPALSPDGHTVVAIRTEDGGLLSPATTSTVVTLALP